MYGWRTVIYLSIIKIEYPITWTLGALHFQGSILLLRPGPHRPGGC